MIFWTTMLLQTNHNMHSIVICLPQISFLNVVYSKFCYSFVICNLIYVAPYAGKLKHVFLLESYTTV